MLIRDYLQRRRGTIRMAEQGIDFCQVKAGDVTAYNFNAESSIKTLNAGKAFSAPLSRDKDSYFFANQVYSYL